MVSKFRQDGVASRKQRYSDHLQVENGERLAFFSNSAGKAQMVELEVEKENYITIFETELGCEFTVYQCC